MKHNSSKTSSPWPLEYIRSSATISDLEFAQAIAKVRTLRDPLYPDQVWIKGQGFSWRYDWVQFWDLEPLFDIHPNRLRSKLRRMIRRGLAEGCTCGCRGDIYLTPKGEELLRGEFDEGEDNAR